MLMMVALVRTRRHAARSGLAGRRLRIPFGSGMPVAGRTGLLSIWITRCPSVGGRGLAWSCSGFRPVNPFAGAKRIVIRNPPVGPTQIRTVGSGGAFVTPVCIGMRSPDYVPRM